MDSSVIILATIWAYVIYAVIVDLRAGKKHTRKASRIATLKQQMKQDHLRVASRRKLLHS